MTVGGGCFWCIEAVFKELKGVEKVVSGYSGGTVPGRPTYREVRSGLTGHAEVVQVRFNPNIISYSDLLTVFMTSHDPTSLNRQGGDLGTQYRSVVYFQNEVQKDIAQTLIKEMSRYYEKPIVTEVGPLKAFYEAEENHQDYYAKNPTVAYCSAVITPKLARLRNMHSKKLKKS